MTIPEPYLKSILRFILSFALAYPASGVVMVVLRYILPPSLLFHDPSGSLLGIVVGSLWFGILTPIYLGFPSSDEAGVNHINMYPYIIPTAFVIFFFASKGWRWFKPSWQAAIALTYAGTLN